MTILDSDIAPSGSPDGAVTIGLINRLPLDSRTALAAAHVRDLQIAARHERDEMRRVLNSMGIGFWDWDIAALEMWYSCHVTELLGYEQTDMDRIANLFRALIHPDDEEQANAVQNSILDGDEDNYRAEFRVRHKDGHWVWLEAIGRVVVRADDRTALRIAGMFNGVDGRRQEQANTAFLNSLTQEMLGQIEPETIKKIAIRRLGTFLQADRVSFGRLNGERQTLVVKTEWRGADVPPLTGEWSTPACKQAIAHAAANRTNIVIRDVKDDPFVNDDETRARLMETQTAAAIIIPLVIGEDVRSLLLVTHSVPRNWQDHEIALVRTVATRLWDAVLRARAVQRSKADRALLDLALRTAKLGARERDLVTGEVRASDNFHRVIGHPEATDMTVDEYLSHIHPEDRDRIKANVLQSRRRRGHGLIMDEHRIITADEKIRHISLMAQYYVPQGETDSGRAYSATIVQDVTEQREREIENARAQERLLKQSRLSAMGIMASTLAHELNQPLAAAVNYLSVVETLADQGQAAMSDDISDYISRALAKIMQAGITIRRVRSFAADGAVETAPHNLRELVFRAISSLFGRAARDGISIANTVPKDLIVQVEPLLLEHAISNLLNNAADALAGAANGRIRISAQAKGDQVELHIGDNGPGMSDAVAADLFTPFATTKPDGTGLGLPICRTMVEANGGKIELKEHGPTGTVFRISLPLVDQQ